MIERRPGRKGQAGQVQRLETAAWIRRAFDQKRATHRTVSSIVTRRISVFHKGKVVVIDASKVGLRTVPYSAITGYKPRYDRKTYGY